MPSGVQTALMSYSRQISVVMAAAVFFFISITIRFVICLLRISWGKWRVLSSKARSWTSSAQFKLFPGAELAGFLPNLCARWPKSRTTSMPSKPNVDGQPSMRQPDGNHTSACADAVHGRAECGSRYGGYDRSVCPPFAWITGSVFFGGVDNQTALVFWQTPVCRRWCRWRQRVRQYFFAYWTPSCLNRPRRRWQSTVPDEHWNFNGFISGHTCTSNAGSLRRIQTFRDFDCVIGTHDAVGCYVTPSDGVARVQYSGTGFRGRHCSIRTSRSWNYQRCAGRGRRLSDFSPSATFDQTDALRPSTRPGFSP